MSVSSVRFLGEREDYDFLQRVVNNHIDILGCSRFRKLGPHPCPA